MPGEKMRTETPDWPQLSGRYGFATRIPKRIAELTSPRSSTRYDAWATLADELVGEAEWYSTSGPALALLLDTVDGAPEPDLLLLLAGEILGGTAIRVSNCVTSMPPGCAFAAAPPAILGAAEPFIG